MAKGKRAGTVPRPSIILDDKIIISRASQKRVMERQHTITLDVDTFKAILLHSWELLPPEKQQELVRIDIYPQRMS